MKKVIDFCIDNSLLVNILTIMIIIVGTLTVYGLRKESFPPVEFDIIMIRTSYPGTSAEDVEKLVTIEIERAIKSVTGIKKTNALSAEGNAIIYLEVDPDYNLDEVFDDIKAAVDGVDDLPEEVTTPNVYKMSNSLRGVMKIALVHEDFDHLRELSKKMRDELEKIPAVALVDMDGYLKDDIKISVDLHLLQRMNITLSEIARAIKKRNLNLSAGKLATAQGDIIVRTLAEFVNIADIEKLIIRSNATGRNIRIRDIAKVTRSPIEGTVLQRSQGKRAIFLDVKIKEKADILRSVKKIKEVTETFLRDNLEFSEIVYRYVDDMSYYVSRRLNILKENGLFGMLLVFGCLMLFLNFRTSLVTSMGAPLSFMIAFIAMDAMGLTLNLISMFALILVLGMLVDDSIIVAEQFYQKIEKGMNPRVAASEAAYETLAPVTVTIFTTMVAFGALFFMGGIMGKFLWTVPAVVIICLFASLFECFFILPGHLADFCKVSPGHKAKRWYQPLLDFYSVTLKKFLKSPFITLLFFIIVLVASLLLAKSMRFELFPGDDSRIVFLQIKGQVGTPLKKTDEAVVLLENIIFAELKQEIEIEDLKSQVGILIGEHGRKTGSHYGSLILYLTPPTEREKSTDDIINLLSAKAKELVPDYVLTVDKVQGGPPKGKPFEIELMSDSITRLKEASKLVWKASLALKGVTSSEIDFEEGKDQVIVAINDEQASRLGVTTFQVALELRQALGEDAISMIRESEEDIDIKIYLSKQYKKNMDFIKYLSVMNNKGRRIPLSRLISYKKVPGAFIIRRLNRKRIFSISGGLDKQVLSPKGFVKEMKPIVAKILKDFPHITYDFAGENQNTNESIEGLIRSFTIAIFCIFFILVVMFKSLGQPLVIMSSIPFGLIGVIIVFFLLGQSLGFMAMMGVVGLVGVVVNDSIVLVNFINIKRIEEGLSLTQAIHDACIDRFRPVILTTVTTVAGLLPIAHASGGDPFLKPMAMSFAWGLFFATAVTLVFIPCTYLVYDRINNFFVRLFVRSKV